MTKPTDTSIARTFLEMHPISSRYASAKRFADVVMAAAERFDAESPAGMDSVAEFDESPHSA